MNAAKPQLNAHQARRLRLRSQRLVPAYQGAGETPASVLQAVFGVQAQNLNAGRLSLAARSRDASLAAMEQARQEKHSIAWSWFMRGTLHLVAAEDARWLVPFLGPRRIQAGHGRMAELGWDEENTQRGLEVLQEGLARPGGLTRAEIIERLRENGLPHTGQAPVHLMMRAAYEGILGTGADRGKTHTYRPFAETAGEPQPLPRPEALKKLASRYLEAYAPAGPRDLAAWAGISLGEVRQGWELLGEEAREVTVEGQEAWMPAARLEWLDEPLDDAPLLRLLPMFDTYLLGYASRALALDRAHQPIVLKNGIIAAVVLVDGRVAGTWRMQAARRRVEIAVDLFEKLDAALQPQLEAEVERMGEFLGVEGVLEEVKQE